MLMVSIVPGSEAVLELPLLLQAVLQLLDPLLLEEEAVLCVVEAAPEASLHLLQLLHPPLQEPCRLEQLLLLELKLLVKTEHPVSIVQAKQEYIECSQSTEEKETDFDLAWQITPTIVKVMAKMCTIMDTSGLEH
jgi:hypothetical protein